MGTVRVAAVAAKTALVSRSHRSSRRVPTRSDGAVVAAAHVEEPAHEGAVEEARHSVRGRGRDQDRGLASVLAKRVVDAADSG